jgi:purine-cytosine permease-like protein
MRDTDEGPNTAPGYRIAMILLGIAVTPVLLSSSSLGSQLSSLALIKVVVIGGIILTILSAITICVGEKARLPTYGIVKYPFGEKGAIAINVLLAVSLFGWIAVTANMFGHSVHDLLAQQRPTYRCPCWLPRVARSLWLLRHLVSNCSGRWRSLPSRLLR